MIHYKSWIARQRVKSIYNALRSLHWDLIESGFECCDLRFTECDIIVEVRCYSPSEFEAAWRLLRCRNFDPEEIIDDDMSRYELFYHALRVKRNIFSYVVHDNQ